ncbi:hypothetical protein [Schaalia hyovaginalis]|uniref:Uncharacterized protein YukE n=1 Tax=Schaalia hyovaginalis TaxID=29316 RepID=A0A923IXV9_9ACTO|nr:hypothetical protein [Schaalia hyovaginalis]MBB6333726.1 uncharacterized protein YukE [Schaalia hyovaginalis]MDY2667908.1 hypothetical protein [Schaalia hyovaginalis]
MNTIAINTELLRAQAKAMSATAETLDGTTIPAAVDLGRSTASLSKVLSDLDQRAKKLAEAVRSFSTNLTQTANDFESHEDRLLEHLRSHSIR